MIINKMQFFNYDSCNELATDFSTNDMHVSIEKEKLKK